MKNSSQEEYGSESIAQDYAKRSDLQKPERTILGELGTKLSKGSMLDIGVGGGRTTVHFAPLAKQYLGLDYSTEMVEACQSRFGETYEFVEGDVRKMDRFDDHSFDFILFSYNGLDYIGHSDRLIALREIDRILKPGGLFCFSTHNIGCCSKLFTFKSQFSLDPRTLIDQCSVWAKLRLRLSKAEMARIQSSEHAFFFDGYRDTYYIQPNTQILQLEEAGFKNTRVFSLDTGSELAASRVSSATDYWLYFLAEKK